MFNVISSFSAVIIASLTKEGQGVLVADSVNSAAKALALNGGAKNKISDISTAVAAYLADLTPKSGDLRVTPRSIPAIALRDACAMILREGAGIGARLEQGAGEGRDALATSFGTDVATAYLANIKSMSDAYAENVKAASEDRKAKAKAATVAAPVAAPVVTPELTIVEIDADQRALITVLTLDPADFAARINPRQLSVMRALCDAATVAQAQRDAKVPAVLAPATQAAVEAASDAVADTAMLAAMLAAIEAASAGLSRKPRAEKVAA